MNSGGIRSGRVDRIWPILANVGPSSSSELRSRFAWRRRPTAPSASGLPNSSFRPCLAKTVAILVPRDIRCGSVGVSTALDRIVVDGRVTVVTSPSRVVFTMITVHRALWLMRFGTLPSRNSLRPAIPALPTTRTSMACSSVAWTIARAGSSSITTCARPRSPATWVAYDCSSSAAARARVTSAVPCSVSAGWSGITTWTTCSSAE